MNNYPYIDPGLSENRTTPFNQKWGNEPASPAGDWPSRAASAYLQWRAGNDPMPGMWAPIDEHEAWMNRQDQMSFVPGGGGVAGWTKLIRSPSGANMIQAFHNATNKPVGSLGFRQLPGKPAIMQDIKVDPSAQGQGYAKELLDAFRSEAGESPRFGGTITNSLDFWKNLRQKWADMPSFASGLDQALEYANQWR